MKEWNKYDIIMPYLCFSPLIAILPTLYLICESSYNFHPSHNITISHISKDKEEHNSSRVIQRLKRISIPASFASLEKTQASQVKNCFIKLN